MEEIKAPNKLITKTGHKKIFLAGSIEMGKAENWQTKVSKAMKDEDVILYNPRRDDWDSSWEQKKENKQFREQVEWELDAMDKADLIIMYFDKETKSPITLLELGLHANEDKLLVCCPEGFWRKGNVDIVCERYGIKQVDTIDDLIESLKNSKMDETIQDMVNKIIK